MTNERAIELLLSHLNVLKQDAINEASRYLIEAMDLAIAALRENAKGESHDQRTSDCGIENT